jgi:hypothetical protein
MTYGVVRAFQVIVNTLESSPEKAALYHCFKRVRNGQGSPESLKGRGHIGDRIRCFLLLLERHPVRPCSCSLLELRLAIPLSRR